MTVTYEQYEKDLSAFCDRVDGEFHIETSGLDENGRYTKWYISDKGNCNFYEVNDIVYEKAIATVRGIKVEVKVALCRTEYWTTYDSKSRFVYTR